jgi:probable RNA-binding protein EIF1AD
MPKPKRNINAVAEETLTPPDALQDGQQIARLQQAAGNNLYHVELPAGESMLVELAHKFRSTIWLKRGSYVVVDTTALADRENKLDGKIVNVVGDEKSWRKMAFWPTEFTAKKASYDSDTSDEGPQMPPSEDEAD